MSTVYKDNKGREGRKENLNALIKEKERTLESEQDIKYLLWEQD